MFLEIKSISKSYNKPIIKDINISIEKREFVSLLGESGSGKSTLFNILSGLAEPDTGEILLEGENILGKKAIFSYMQQKDLLIPFYTIIDNIALPLILQGTKKSKAREKVREYLEEFSLQGSENKYPSQLSGGMRQRASLLRAYIYSQNIMLLDEPFSALDSMTKANMYKWYKNMAKKHETTTFFITHDIDEAILLSDKIYILKGEPATISEVIEIRDKDEDFELSLRFLEYKKMLKEKLNLN